MCICGAPTTITTITVIIYVIVVVVITIIVMGVGGHMCELLSSQSSSPESFVGVVFVIVLARVVVIITILARVIVEIVTVIAIVMVVVSVVVVVVCSTCSLELHWLSCHSWWVTQLGSVLGLCRHCCCRCHGGGGGSWWRTQLGAAFKLADCLPLPWLVGHTAWVCVGSKPLVIITIAVVVGSWLAELSQEEAIHTKSIEKAVCHENAGACNGCSQWSHLHLLHPFVGGALHTGASAYTNT